MKKILTLIIACFILSGSAHAALPPLYHSIHILETILDHQDLQDHIGNAEQIQELRVLPTGQYLLVTDNKSVVVQVIYIEEESQGQGQGVFEIHFRDL